MIHGVRTKALKVIPDERGRVMEILRADDALFMKFGQVYVTTTLPQVVKAWHYHKIQTDHIVAVQGMIKLVLYDPIFHWHPQPNVDSSTQWDLSWVEMYQ